MSKKEKNDKAKENGASGSFKVAKKPAARSELYYRLVKLIPAVNLVVK